MKDVRLYSPRNLEIDSIISLNPFPSKGYKKDHLQFLIHCLIIRESYYDHAHLKKIGKKDGFIPLNAKILEKKVTKYSEHLEYLKSVGIVECDNSYRVGIVSKGYRLARHYKGKGIKRVDITDFVLRRKIRSDNPFKSSNEAHKSFPYLAKWFNSNKLQIDKEAAFRYINMRALKAIDAIDSNLSEKKRDERRQMILENCDNAKISVSRIAAQDFYFKKDKAGHRLHTNLTNLSKRLRQFINYDNQQLVALDIKNSQPYISLALLKKSFWQTPKKTFINIKGISREIEKGIEKERRKINNSIMFLDSPEPLTGIAFEKNKFVKNVVEGQFYEYLVDLFEKGNQYSLGSSPIEKRNKVKKMLLTVLFDNGNKIYNRALDSPYQAFCSAFPNITDLFNLIKEHKHSNLAILLQRIESFLLLDKACKRICTEHPEIPIFTIHDSIITTVGNEQHVISIILDELTKYMGVPPTLSTDPW